LDAWTLVAIRQIPPTKTSEIPKDSHKQGPPLARTNPGRPYRRFLLVCFAVLLLLTVLSYVLRRPILRAAGQALVQNDGVQKADCIWVLGGDDFGSRILYAGQLARSGYAPYVLVDGPGRLIGHESDTTIEYAVQQGLPASLFRPVWLPEGVDSTRTEVRYVAETILRPANVHKVLLVTSNYHTRRAARFAREEVPWLHVSAVPASDRYFSPDGWWKSRNGRKIFLLEWMKTILESWG
jgi:uncharacterized SAM-binding protein YcdF (DUF218 family)